ncbi:MAG TPA: nucleotide exchange factor GrpE [Candidatus Sumerlaeota bacterium]|nr:nucleotide exchange factor GrpE [Candidatus Sumerlaeota bacterium]HON50079.1 nucleotide exchange factor GrpE [Candidatus Sumerlaeota bacterium]HOR63295.1 nucleotide exchange factor GrpE [Candidatus Sumerlaeota bacterium]HPL74046.1 nucleotide exchange factor GrpE [Candidatus Sumerlaeota bacterium]HRU54224.1 nucleotide exchange factor GrpE [Candidatus Sumerlaeia bacterium]
MKSLFEIMLNKYFVIDAPRLDVYQEPPKTGNNSETSQPDDLVTQISSIMVENVRLMDIKKELEERSSSPEVLEEFIKRQLPLIDGFERVLGLARQYPPSVEIDNWLKSVETIYYRMLKIFEKYGLKTLDTIGKPVNLNFHDVVEYRPTTEYPNEVVICERQKGYLLKGKLIRDAKVVVAYNPSSA